MKNDSTPAISVTVPCVEDDDEAGDLLFYVEEITQLLRRSYQVAKDSEVGCAREWW